MTPEKLAALRRLHEAATPGNWHLGGPEVTIYPLTTRVSGYGWKQDLANGDLIAAARNALPELLDEIERLRAQNEQLLTNDQCAIGALVEAGERLAERDKLQAAMQRIQHFATLRMIAGAPGFDRIEEMAREALGKNSASR